MENSIALANQIVQVSTEAKARPIITSFTTISAARNMPQGLRSFGSVAEADAAGWAAVTDCGASTGVADNCDGLGSAEVPDTGSVGVCGSEGGVAGDCAVGVDEPGAVRPGACAAGATGACATGVCGAGASGTRAAGAIAGGWMMPG